MTYIKFMVVLLSQWNSTFKEEDLLELSIVICDMRLLPHNLVPKPCHVLQFFTLT